MTTHEVIEQWKKSRPEDYDQFQDVLGQLKRRKIRGPHHCSRYTLSLLKGMMETCHWEHTHEMMNHFRAVGVTLSEARPMELALGCIVRRVLFIVRDEYGTKLDEEAQKAGRSGAGSEAYYSAQQSLTSALSSKGGAVDFTKLPLKDVMSSIKGSVNELIEELDTVREAISEQAEEHIPDGAKILTFGKSRSVEKFILAAAEKKRTFQVIVCESAPYYGGHEMAKSLSDKGIDVTVIQDAAVFALMPLVDKVFLPTHAVMANGGLIAPSGSQLVALAAREHAVPIVCITSLFKLCPEYPHDLDQFNELTSPADVLPYGTDQKLLDRADVLNPEYDYVGPDLIDLYVTNTGGHQPSYIYRLLAEHYHPEDRSLDPR